MAKATVHKVTPYIIMDFETGGLLMNKCGLTEIAMISIKGDTLEKINEYETLIAPHQIQTPVDVKVDGKIKYKVGDWINAEYHQGAIDVTGLTVERLKAEGKDIEQVVEEVQAFLKEANVYKSTTGYKPVLVAHNAQFEVKCLQNLAYGRFDLSKYFHGQEDFFGNFAPHYIDTLDLAKLIWAPNTRQTAYKLGDVLDRAGIPIFDGHRAMNDVRPSTQFFEYVIRLLRIAEKSGLLTSVSSSETNEAGEQVNTNDRIFKFQIPDDEL
jgi:DNA polymerase III epsilon subunit-like protein